jgi:predicted lysophospholipase L1 biosynthesis ABC-type transport system permease subunit
VIGVVDDVRKTWTEENPADLYVPIAQSPPIIVELVVRDPAGRARIDEIRDAIWTVNPELPLNEIRWLDDTIAVASLPSRFLAWLLSGFALFAVALATLGLYGVIAYAVSARRREIAIRMALGADAAGVLRLFTRDAAKLIAIGSVAGIAGGLAIVRVLGSQLHGVSPLDPGTWITLTLLLALIAFGATHIPSRRAARTEPMRILQRE